MVCCHRLNTYYRWNVVDWQTDDRNCKFNIWNNFWCKISSLDMVAAKKHYQITVKHSLFGQIIVRHAAKNWTPSSCTVIYCSSTSAFTSISTFTSTSTFTFPNCLLLLCPVTLSFYRAMLCIRGTSHGRVSVRLFVCPPQVGVLLKRLNVGWHKQHHSIAQGL